MFCLVISKVDQGYKKHLCILLALRELVISILPITIQLRVPLLTPAVLVSLESEGRNSTISAWPWLTEGVGDRGSGTLGQ